MALAEQIAKKQRLYFDKADTPHAIVDVDGKILWANDNFLAISKNIEVGDNVERIFEELTGGILKNIGDEKIDLLLAHDDKRYKAHLRVVGLSEKEAENVQVYNDNDKVIMLYLTDETDYYILKQKYDAINSLYQNKEKLKKFLLIESQNLLTKNNSDGPDALILFENIEFLIDRIKIFLAENPI